MKNNKIPAETDNTKKVLVATSTSFQGPIPHPDILREYDDIIPGAAERLIVMVEKQNAHRIELEKSLLTSQLKESRRGQVFALIIGLSGLVSAVALSAWGHDIVAGACLTAPIFSLATAFIRGKNKQIKELKDKEI